ncbi:GM14290 [Drosophila sechellia]|uniref:GM14290 n=1 Tax=Drosophila sechellia TaxID=7238 RepID=B4HVD3_DROSE|nr:GM14290 [Drosophila sechellia]
MEQQLKLQRAVHQQRKLVATGEVTRSVTPVKGQVIGSRRVIVKNPDGTTRIIQQAVTQVSRTGGANTAAAAASPTVGGSTSTQSNPSTSTPHKVQIIRGPDGKVSVRGLNPGQQLVQMPDGKLHVLTTTTSSNSAGQGNKIKVPIKPASASSSPAISSAQTTTNPVTPMIKQIAVKHVTKNSATQSIASSSRVALPLAQIKNKLLLAQQQQQSTSSSPATSSSPVQKIVSKVVNASTSGQAIQQVLVQSGSKLVLGQNAQGQKVIISTSAAQQQGTSPVQQQQLVQSQPIQQSPQQISMTQQQIVVGGQRLILSPGQTIVTQRNVPQSQALQMVQQQNQTQQQQQQHHVVQPQQQFVFNQNQIVQSSPVHKTKLVKQLVVQQQSQQTIEEKTQISTTDSNETGTQQVLVPNSTLAQQLAQGKLQVATVNGQQVIVKPLGNNQAQIVAHIKHQGDGNAHIVTSNSATAVPQANPQNSPVKQQALPPQSPQQVVVQQQQIHQQSPTNFESGVTPITQQPVLTQTVQAPAQQQALSVEESLLQNQPPGTVIKCVTAQVLQTEHGPRIVLQGLVGNDFTAQQLQLVQTQVKQQLMKAQESNGKLGVLGPTKIYLAVQPENAVQSQPPPLTPVHQSAAHQQTNNIEIDADTLATTYEANSTIKDIAINNGDDQENSKCAETENSNITTNESFAGTSSLLEGSEQKEPTNLAVFDISETDLENKQNESFVVTRGYIQKCNLSPELEEKLVCMQKHTRKCEFGE